ncbi:MAG: hypothetical protein AAF944_29770, partial [Bacteroidota bacterium]
MGILRRMSYPVLTSFLLTIISLSQADLSQAQNRTFRLPKGISDTDYLPGTIVLKLRTKQNSAARFSTVSAMRQIQKIAHTSHITSVLRQSAKVNPLARQKPTTQIYRLRTDRDVVATINQLLQLEEVVYAE